MTVTCSGHSRVLSLLSSSAIIGTGDTTRILKSHSESVNAQCARVSEGGISMHARMAGVILSSSSFLNVL